MSTSPGPQEGILAIDHETLRRIEAFARQEGISPSEVVHRAFEAYEASRGGAPADEADGVTVYDVLSRSGLIGCLKGRTDSPTDLSTNPIHMEGFGRE